MVDEDEPTDASDEVADSEDFAHSGYDDADAEIAEPAVFDSNEISVAEDSMSDDFSSDMDNGVTQAQVYDNLKRIGELEDEKKRIQEEIQSRTEQLREVIAHIDRGSILYKMLESALKDFGPARAGSPKKAAKGAAQTAPKSSKKKSRGK